MPHDYLVLRDDRIVSILDVVSSPEPSTTHEAPLRLALATGFYLDAGAARLGLNRTDLEFLLLLSLEEPLTAGELSEASGLTTGGTSGVLDRLERSGLIARQSDPDDRRRVVVRLTPDARDRLGGLAAPLADSIDSPDRLSQLAAATAALRMPPGDDARSDADGAISAPLSGVSEGRVEIAGGAYALRLGGGGPLAMLFRAQVEGGGVRARAAEGLVVLRGSRRLFRGRAEGDIALNSAIPWRVRLHGGSNVIDAQLSGLVVAGIEVSGGSGTVQFSLGPARGNVPIRIGGGAMHITIHRPAGAAARVRVQGGLVELELDGERPGRSYSKRWQTAGFDIAGDGYDITVRGGMSTLVLDQGAGLAARD